MKRPPNSWIIILLTILFAVGTLGHALSSTLPLMLLLTPWFLGFCAAVVLGFSPLTPRLLVWAGVSYLVTFTLEALGVATGAIFGPYHYGSVLGIGAFGVPFIIGLNWVLVIWGALGWASRWLKNSWWAPFLAALLAVGFDYLLEPMAIWLGYWTWHTPSIPLQNYLAWFLIALAMGLAYRGLRLPPTGPIPRAYFLIQGAFFGILGFFK